MSLSNLLKVAEEVAQVNEVPFEQEFINQYNKALLEVAQDSEQETPVGVIRPSSLGGCKRNIFLAYIGAKKDEPDLTDEWTYNLIGINESGTDRHARIQAVLGKMEELGVLQNLDIEEVVREANMRGIKTKFVGWNEDKTEARCINEDIGISFQSDGAFMFNGKEVLFEIKTANIFKFNKVKKANTPLPEHLTQATAYAMGLGIDWVLFFYEDRDFTQHHLMLVNITEDMKKEVQDKIEEIRQAHKSRVIPAGEFDKCQYCRYKAICQAMDAEEVLLTTELEEEIKNGAVPTTH